MLLTGSAGLERSLPHHKDWTYTTGLDAQMPHVAFTWLLTSTLMCDPYLISAVRDPFTFSYLLTYSRCTSDLPHKKRKKNWIGIEPRSLKSAKADGASQTVVIFHLCLCTRTSRPRVTLGFLPPCVSHSSNWQSSPDLAEILKKEMRKKK